MDLLPERRRGEPALFGRLGERQQLGRRFEAAQHPLRIPRAGLEVLDRDHPPLSVEVHAHVRRDLDGPLAGGVRGGRVLAPS